MSGIQNVRVVVACPSCGSPDYEIEFDGGDLAQGVQISIPCEDCPRRIAVDVDVSVQSVRTDES
jgi:hypothetical protein